MWLSLSVMLTNDAEMNWAEVALWLLFALPAKAVTIHLPGNNMHVWELFRSKEEMNERREW